MDFESFSEMKPPSADFIKARSAKLCIRRPDIGPQPYLDANTIAPPAQTDGVHIKIYG